MSHKEMCIDWVNDRQWQHDDGTWQRCDPRSGECVGPIYKTQEELDAALWSVVFEEMDLSTP